MIFIASIRAYQLCLSPFLVSSCRFHPTCSQYAIDAVRHYGLIKGLFYSIRRVLRCHPLNPGGYDPIT